MAKLTQLSVHAIGCTCAYISAADILALRSANRDLNQKTSDSFAGLFNSIKVSFCQPSLDTFESLSQNEGIAKAIENVTFGTETLDQYYHVVNALREGGTAEQRAQYDGWLNREMHGRTDAVHMLREILFRLPNLKSIRAEDRPSGSNGLSREDYIPGLASKKIQKLTGIDLRWNGPYPQSSHTSDTRTTVFPVESRQFVYAAVFILVRDLDIAGAHVDLDLIIGGCTDALGHSYFIPPFDASKALPRRIISRNLRHLEIHDIDMDSWPTIYYPDTDLRSFLSKITFGSITFNRCSFRGKVLHNAFQGFQEIVLTKCEDVMDFDIVIYQHRPTLRSVVISNVSMTLCDLRNKNQWGEFFEALCAESSMQHVQLRNLRTGISYCKNLREYKEAHSNIYAVTWDGNEAIKASAQAAVKVLQRLALKEAVVPPVLDLINSEDGYPAER